MMVRLANPGPEEPFAEVVLANDAHSKLIRAGFIRQVSEFMVATG
jgi:hypothetical protein